MDEPGRDPSVVLARMGHLIWTVSQSVEQAVIIKTLPGNQHIQNDEDEGNSHEWKGIGEVNRDGMGAPAKSSFRGKAALRKQCVPIGD